MYEMRHVIGPEEVVEVYNHVHHATALRLFEQARLKHIESIGFAQEKLLAEGVFLVITSLQVRYKRELILGEQLIITCENCSQNRKLVQVDQRMIKSDGKVAVEASIEMACMSGDTRRAMTPPEDFMAAFLAPNSSGV